MKFRRGNDDRNTIYFNYLLPWYFQTPLCLFILCAAPLKTMLTRVTRDGTICAAKNSTFGYFDGTNPVTVSSPNYGYRHNAKMAISSRVKNNIFAKEKTKLSRTKLYNSCLVFFTWTSSMSQYSIVLVLNDLYDTYILLFYDVFGL